MYKLKEHKSEINHYYTDDQGFQGEYKWWLDNGHLRKHCFYKDNMYHGEYKEWSLIDTTKIVHKFYQNHKDITEEVIALVSNIKKITHKEKLIIKLTYGIDCISKEITFNNH